MNAVNQMDPMTPTQRAQVVHASERHEWRALFGFIGTMLLLMPLALMCELGGQGHILSDPAFVAEVSNGGPATPGAQAVRSALGPVEPQAGSLPADLLGLGGDREVAAQVNDAARFAVFADTGTLTAGGSALLLELKQGHGADLLATLARRNALRPWVWVIIAAIAPVAAVTFRSAYRSDAADQLLARDDERIKADAERSARALESTSAQRAWWRS